MVPSGSIPDGLQPETFFTYQIVYMPDLTHKYGLRVKGGSGEMRATLNLVNGWMFTGPGPLYFGNSTTAQNLTSASGLMDSAATFVASTFGGPAGAAAQAVAGKAKGTLGQQALTDQGPKGLDLTQKIDAYAELHVYEPKLSVVNGKTIMTWVELTDLNTKFDRNVIGVSQSGAPQQPAPGVSLSSDQIVAKVKSITVADGTAGGKFIVVAASVDATTG